MTINYLTLQLPPPVNPSEIPTTGAWTVLERRLGTMLPDDYKEFIELYGSGRVGRFLWIFNPFSANENLNLEKQIATQANVLFELQSYGEAIPYKSFPEPGGILPFGITDNGDVLFWRVTGDPNNWHVVVNESRAPDWEGYELSMSRFLAEILQRHLTCNIFPKNFPEQPVIFEASSL